jgi:very-short-patch-repair endonuclease/RecA/RadA recombinase
VERFFYGYPCFLDDQDFITPLFVMEVGVNSNPDGSFTMRPIDPNGLQVNHHLFRRQHAELEQLQAIQDELEGPFGSFAARLRAAFEYLGTELPTLHPDHLDPFPSKETPRDQWINRAVLFRSERSKFTFHLRRELDALVRYERLLDEVMQTSVGPILAPGRLPRSPVGERKVDILEVLPLDQQQEIATRGSLGARLTVVTGPPGTGKSQLVVDILASCADAGEAVLFASKNGKAVDVVRERLRAILGEDHDWTLRLGNAENMERCREEMLERLGSVKTGGGARDGQKLEDLLDDFDRQTATLQRRVEQVARRVERLEAAETARRAAEALVPERWIDALELEAASTGLDSAKVLRARDEAVALSGRAPLGLWLWLRRLFLGARLRERLLDTLGSVTESLPEDVSKEVLSEARRDLGYDGLVEGFENVVSLCGWLDALHALDSAAADLRSLPGCAALAQELRELKQRKAEVAAQVLQRGWTDMIASHRPMVLHLVRQYFDLSEKIRRTRGGREWAQVLDEFTDTIQDLGTYLPVWIVTNLSARRSLPLQPNLFDLVVIDEASQCDVASGLPLLFRARRAVIIGDPHQLRHISTLRLDREADIARQAGAQDLLPEWSYVRRSLYDAAESAVLDSGDQPAFLAEHYRSYPDVIEFSNRVFYQSRLVLRTDVAALVKRFGGQPLGVFWHDTPGKVPETVRSAWNDEELSAVVSYLGHLCEGGFLPHADIRIGIVTPFRLQMERIEEALRGAPWWESVRAKVIVGTAHRFQGDECDLVLFSPVVAAGMRDRTARWVAETDQLLNVAITRARGALHIFGDLQACRRAGGYLAQLADHVASGQLRGVSATPFDSDAEEKMAAILDQLALWYHHHYPEGRYELDFLVVSPFGTRYDVEVDGLTHWTSEGLAKDAVRDTAVESAGYRVVRVAARDVYEREDLVRLRLARLP